MYTKSRITKLFPLAISAAALAFGAQAGNNQGQDEDEDELEFEVTELYLELNDTDGDLGFHGLIDGDAWKSLRIEGPNGRKLLNAWIRGGLRRQGLTEFFFESAEPVLGDGPDELDPDVFFKRFPEGEYEVEGVTLDGQEIEGETELSHTLAAPAELILNGTEGGECWELNDAIIGWEHVTESHPTLGNLNESVTVEKYELVVEIERGGVEPSPEVIKLVLDVLPTGNDLMFEIPESFLLQAGDDDEFKFEIVTRLDNGNQTAVEACFELAD